MVDEATLSLLNAFEDWNDVDSVLASLPGYDPASVREAVGTLHDAGLLHTLDQAEREDLPAGE